MKLLFSIFIVLRQTWCNCTYFSTFLSLIVLLSICFSRFAFTLIVPLFSLIFILFVRQFLVIFIKISLFILLISRPTSFLFFPMFIIFVIVFFYVFFIVPFIVPFIISFIISFIVPFIISPIIFSTFTFLVFSLFWRTLFSPFLWIFFAWFSIFAFFSFLIVFLFITLRISFVFAFNLLFFLFLFLECFSFRLLFFSFLSWIITLTAWVIRWIWRIIARTRRIAWFRLSGFFSFAFHTFFLLSFTDKIILGFRVYLFLHGLRITDNIS